ncbi:uncharacterized protein PFLUO_LOCUS2625 [Penicillium psychrofluorescens]|uniref:uncharacterized protein n=1 Tax=Penicillium psychrofluorescens TaxID=3158075 RepID=UPI003CCCA7B3
MPELSPLTCDDECSRLERNRSLASALGVDINQSTTIQTITATNLPYSSETLDQYIQLASSAPLSTLQTYESSLHSLAASTSQRSFRFQPAKSTLRAFAHSLATDWGFVTESHDPDPHRHVFVLKPLSWTPPVFGLGSSSSAIGIGGMSVRECVKLRERERTKESEARRVAALEAKAARDALRTQSASGEGGWAQVASRGKKDGTSSASTRSTTPVPAHQGLFNGGSMFAALAGDNAGGGMKKKERLVLRSGIGAGKSLRALQQQQANVEVVDSWEEAEEKEEQVEREQEEIEPGLELKYGQEKIDGDGVAQVQDQDEAVEDSESSMKPGDDSGSPVLEESQVSVADADDADYLIV